MALNVEEKLSKLGYHCSNWGNGEYNYYKDYVDVSCQANLMVFEGKVIEYKIISLSPINSAKKIKNLTIALNRFREDMKVIDIEVE